MQLINESDNGPVCPICLSPNYKILYKITINMGIEHLGINPESEQGAKLKSIIRKLWEGDVSDFVQCMSCSFVYADPFIAGT
ncbi:MAG: hypothetical protein AMS27_13895, partial [Bacteroides sp. SM23_62_1]